jgi:hypothetical protein
VSHSEANITLFSITLQFAEVLTVVAGDSSGAYVDILSNLYVAQVGQMAHVGARPNMSSLDLAEIADICTGLDHGAHTQPRKGPNAAVFSHGCLFQV